MLNVGRNSRIAVIGSGIAGLTAAWALGRQHQVTLYELHDSLGMDAEAAAFEIGGREIRVDVPMRVFFSAYYPLISKLYRHLGIESDRINYSASFTGLERGYYFQYSNFSLGNQRIPYLPLSALTSPRAMVTGLDFLRLNQRMAADLERGGLDDITLEAYCRRLGISDGLRDGFLIPTYAGICTCSYERVRRYPASIIAEFLTCGLVTSSMRRVRHGTREVVQKLSEKVQELRLGSPVASVLRKEDGVEVTAREKTDLYDHVVFATQANHTRKILTDISKKEDDILACFQYERNSVLMHTDPRLAPRKRSWWEPVNYILKEGASCPMATIWMNGVHPSMDADVPVFQTWHPYLEPKAEALISEASFERPVVTLDSLKAIGRLQALQADHSRRIWFCGSYAWRGIPLLESAALSGLAVAKRLGCTFPFDDAVSPQSLEHLTWNEGLS